MNDAGQLTLHKILGVPSYFWDPSTGFTNIGTFGGRTVSTDIDESGRIVGYSSPTEDYLSHPTDDRAFIWDRANGIRSLGTLGTRSWASVIDESGTVAGMFHHTDGMHLFRWTDATGMVDLGVLDEGRGVRSIASDGSIHGTYGSGTYPGGVFRWSPSSGIEIWATPLPGMRFEGITDDGRWVGNQDPHTTPKAFIWTPGDDVVYLMPDATRSWAFAANARGDVVLVADDEGYFWNADRGLIPLNDGRGRIGPRAISDNGFIAGTLWPPAAVQTFLMRLHLEPLTPGSVSAVVAPANVTVSWSAPRLPEGDDPATAYRIYRDDIFIGTIDSATTSFIDHDPLVGIHAYTVIAENAFGSSRASAPATAIVTTALRGIAVTPTATPVAASPTFAG